MNTESWRNVAAEQPSLSGCKIELRSTDSRGRLSHRCLSLFTVSQLVEPQAEIPISGL